MKKKIWLWMLISVIGLASPAEALAFSLETPEVSDFSGDAAQEEVQRQEELEFLDEKVQKEIPAYTEEPAEILSRDNETNKLELNKYYDAQDLVYGNGYELELNIPEDGRIRILLEDCYGTNFYEYFYLPAGCSRNWRSKGVNTIDSGWITVKAGTFIPRFHGSLNKETRLVVQYQTLEEYNGEREDNDTYDMATPIVSGIVYEGDYSKEYDDDIYKFHMEQPGKAQINIKYLNRNFDSYCWLYEEDVHGNVYEIECITNSDQPRLGIGNYFIKVHPSRWPEDIEYTLCVTTNYESADTYEQEPNNVKSQANEKEANVWYTGNLNTSSDIDYFKFIVDKKSYLSLEFQVPRQLKANIVKIALYDQELNLLDSVKNTSNPYIQTKEALYDKGTYYVRVDGSSFGGDYSFCLNQREYVPKKNISGLTYSPVKAREYTGSAIRPSIMVEDEGDFTILEQGEDYTVSYKNNKNVGTASIIVKGIGNYTGTKTIKFQITPKKPVLSSVKQAGSGKLKITWKKAAGAQGYALYRATSQYGTYSRVKVITSANTLTYTNSGLKSGKKYYYKVRAYKAVNGKNIFSGYSSVKSGTTKKAAASKTVAVDGVYTYGTTKITVYKQSGQYYAKAYGRGGRMNTTVRLYGSGSSYKAYYESGGDLFFSISNITSTGANIYFPYISEFSGWYRRS